MSAMYMWKWQGHIANLENVLRREFTSLAHLGPFLLRTLPENGISGNASYAPPSSTKSPRQSQSVPPSMIFRPGFHLEDLPILRRQGAPEILGESQSLALLLGESRVHLKTVRAICRRQCREPCHFQLDE